jgi:hypothetical protein
MKNLTIHGADRASPAFERLALAYVARILWSYGHGEAAALLMAHRKAIRGTGRSDTAVPEAAAFEPGGVASVDISFSRVTSDVDISYHAADAPAATSDFENDRAHKTALRFGLDLSDDQSGQVTVLCPDCTAPQPSPHGSARWYPQEVADHQGWHTCPHCGGRYTIGQPAGNEDQTRPMQRQSTDSDTVVVDQDAP